MMSLVSNLIGPVSGLLDKVIEDKDQKAKLAHEIATMSDNHAQQALMGQSRSCIGFFIQRWMETVHRLGMWRCFCISLCLTAIDCVWCNCRWCRHTCVARV